MASNSEFRIPSLIEKELEKFDTFLNVFKADLSLIALNQNQKDSIVKLMSALVSESQNSIDFLLKNTVTRPEKIVGDLLGRFTNFLDGINSNYKRLILYLSAQLSEFFILIVSTFIDIRLSTLQFITFSPSMYKG